MPQQGKDHARLIDRLRARQFKTCGVSYCRTRTAGLSGLCATHRTKKRNTGDPKAGTIPRSVVRKIAAKAESYINTYRGIAPLEAGLGWSAKWLASGKQTAGGWSGLEPKKAAAKYLGRLQAEGVTDVGILSTLTAMAYLQAHCPGTVRSDAHERHQLIVHTLGLAPWPVETRRDLSAAGFRKRYFRPAPAVVAELFRAIPVDVRRLAQRIAEKLYEAETGQLTVPADVLASPLPEATQ